MRAVALLLIGAAAVAGLTSDSPAAEIDFEYQVMAVDLPTHSVVIKQPGIREVVYDHFWSLEDAQIAATKLEDGGHNASVREFRMDKRWIADNSYVLDTFDNYDDALDYANIVMATTGLYTWIRSVEVIPGGP